MLFTLIANYVSVTINIPVIMGRISAHSAAVGIYLHPLEYSASLLLQAMSTLQAYFQFFSFSS